MPAKKAIIAFYCAPCAARFDKIKNLRVRAFHRFCLPVFSQARGGGG
jgi:hypothetical protein